MAPRTSPLLPHWHTRWYWSALLEHHVLHGLQLSHIHLGLTVLTASKLVQPKKPKVTPEMQQHQRKATARMLELGVPPVRDEDVVGKMPCPVCHQLRTASDRTPDGLVHRVL